MHLTLHQELIDQVITLAQEAGELIMGVYDRLDQIDVAQKADASPVTEADYLAHRHIVSGLQALTPQWPVLSEEGTIPDYSERKIWQRYWLVDPLDGTKEFVNGTGEFTVNIALIDRSVPLMGVVHIPVSGVTYVGQPREKAYRLSSGERQVIHVASVSERLRDKFPITLVDSRSHSQPEVDALCQELKRHWAPVNRIAIGSSLKMCMVAAGEADIYPRFGPTSEWDIAAAHAVVNAAGGVLVDTRLQPLRYNTRESLLNPNFYALGTELEMWRTLLFPDNENAVAD